MSKKPICECGGELEYCEMRTVTKAFQIRNDGKVSKKSRVLGYADFAGSNLECKSCFVIYEANMNKNGVIIRGEKL
jgi:hypothetical protein